MNATHSDEKSSLSPTPGEKLVPFYPAARSGVNVEEKHGAKKDGAQGWESGRGEKESARN
ncbi:hypothetical protein [Geoalkalibacter halelectricus]|uniref:hypothetical protein n=1 Tax=Geoalkalibacter halelectricus TaxID=2847045 RepID=UPI00266F6652|nr:hypothetical protein [Geoalkalibacter halelectricus]